MTAQVVDDSAAVPAKAVRFSHRTRLGLSSQRRYVGARRSQGVQNVTVVLCCRGGCGGVGDNHAQGQVLLLHFHGRKGHGSKCHRGVVLAWWLWWCR